MIRENHTPESSKAMRTAVMLAWSVIVLMMLLNKEKINVNSFVNMNLKAIVTFIWYGMVAASSFMTCLFSRAVLKTLNESEAGSIMALIFNSVLAITISLNVSDISLKTRNTPIDEMLLCAAAGYCLYEMFFLRLAENLRERYKALGVVAVTSFIINTLQRSEGASVLLLYFFLFSAPVPIMKLPSFGSAKYVDSVAYKCSVWAAYSFTLYLRIIVGLGVSYELITRPEFRVYEFDIPLWVSIYCVGIGGTFYFIDVVNEREMEKLKKATEERSRIQECDEKLVKGKDNIQDNIQQEWKMERSYMELKRKVVYAYE